MVGGAPPEIERSRDLLDALSRKWFAVGLSGSGQSMKLVANLVLGLNRAALAEGLHFASTCGTGIARRPGSPQSGRGPLPR